MLTNTLSHLQQNLIELTQQKVDILLKNNYSTMLRILDQGAGWVKLSMHPIFLSAPFTVVQAVSEYIRKNRIAPCIMQYIQENVHRVSSPREQKQLQPTGQVHCLQEIFESLNKQYFCNQFPSIPITWFGDMRKLPQKKLVLGQYHHTLKLIKIHRLLDQKQFPTFFVSFVVYHEMLHHLFPPQMQANGRRSIHTKEFKQQEKRFHDYHKAKQWCAENTYLLFPMS